MKKILLILSLLIVFGSAFSQNLKGYKVTAFDTLRTNKLLQIDTSYTSDGNEFKGVSYWDNDNNTVSTVMGNGVIYQWAKEAYIDGQNDTGVEIPNGTPVMYAGSIGNSGNFRIQLGIASSTSPAFLFIGVTTEPVLDGEVGKITTRGKARGIQTDGANYGEVWSAGDIVYESGTTAGYLTNIAPQAPIPAIPVALVISAHATNGTLEVRPTYPQKLTELSDVNGTLLDSTGQFPVWNNDSSYFDFDYNINDYFITASDTLPASQVSIVTGIGSPTVDQVQEYMDNIGSSGFFLGGELSDGGAGTLDVAAGEGFIRTTNDENAEIQSFKWSASAGIAVTDNTTQYAYVDDTGVISLSTNEFLEAPDLIQIGVVTKEGGVVDHTFGLGVRLQESIGNAGRFIRRVHGIARDKRKGGLIFGQSGDANRDVSITAGSLWWGRTEYPIPTFNTSGVDVFNTYSASGLEDAVATAWPNLQYDNAGTLTNLGNNKWANLFFFIEPDGHIDMVYGRAQFNSEALADFEGVPSTSLPSRISETSILAARFTFQKSSNTATIASAFEQLFANAGVTSHPNLSGLDFASSGHTGFEAAFSKNTGFNKDFGAIAGTVAQGNDSRFHDAVTLSGAYDYITLSGQDIIRGQVDYDTDISNTPDLSIYWKNDGTSTATGNWSIGAHDFTTTGVTTTGGLVSNGEVRVNSDIGFITSRARFYRSSDLGAVIQGHISGVTNSFTLITGNGLRVLENPIGTQNLSTPGSFTANSLDINSNASINSSGIITAPKLAITTNSSFDFSTTTATVTKQANHGLMLKGATGSQNDMAIASTGGSILLENPTGTTNINIPSGTLTVSGTVTHLAPTLSTESALLDDIEGGTRDGDFATLAIAGSPITNSYISNVTEASNNITFTGVGSAFNGSIGSIAKTDVANSFIVSSVGYMMDLFNSNGSGSGLRVRGNNIALSVNDASAVERFRVEGDGDIFALNLSAGTKTNVVYIDPSTKELFEGAAPGGVSFGTSTQIPYMNPGGTDFIYSALMTFSGTQLNAQSFKTNVNYTFTEIASAGTPSAGTGILFEKTDNLPYFKNDAGNEYDLTNASGYEKSSDPSAITGGYVLWQSDGTGSGDDGDIMIRINDGSTTKTITLVDFSAF